MIFKKDDIEILQGILEESSELLRDAEQKIIELEEKKDEDTLKEVFRIFHSLKGLAGFGNITPIVESAHALENLLKKCRDGEMACSSKLIDLLLDGVDFFKLAFGEISSRMDNFNNEDIEIPLENLGHESIIERAQEFFATLENESNIQSKKGENVSSFESTDSEERNEAENEITNNIITEEFQKEIFEEFISELQANINEAENNLLDFEKEKNSEFIKTVMRAMHSIKGGARLVLSSIDYTNNSPYTVKIGYIEKISHALEDVLQEFLNNKRKDVPLDCFFKGIDFIKELGNTLLSTDTKVDEKKIKDFFERFALNNEVEESETSLENNPKRDNMLDDSASKEAVINISNQFVDYARYLLNNSSADPMQLERIAEPLKNGLLMMNYQEKISIIEKIIDLAKKGKHEELKKLLEDFSKWVKEENNNVFSENKLNSEINKNKEKAINHEVAEVNVKHTSQTVRVNQAKLDSLVNLVGELITLKNSVKYIMSEIIDYVPQMRTELKNINLRLERISYEFQSSVMSLRMTPVAVLFKRYNRTVRDLSKSLGKNVTLVTEGEDVELERSVLEILSDPLTHLIRNSIDHGLETPEERIAVGKPEEGKIILRAYYRGNSVVVEVEDDGRGIDAQKIRMKIIDKGLVSQEEALKMSDEQIIQMIFEPGFSTADKVTNLSGRGVGMDVVKTNIEKIGGKVYIRTNPGQGTVTSMVIPQSLMAIKGLLVKIGEELYVIPTDVLRETIKIPKEKITIYKDIIFANIRDEIVQLIFAENILHDTCQDVFLKEFAFDLVPVALIKADSGVFGIIVDKFVEENDYLVKSVPESVQLGGLITGSTIMGDGSVVLILDPTKLV